MKPKRPKHVVGPCTHRKRKLILELIRSAQSSLLYNHCNIQKSYNKVVVVEVFRCKRRLLGQTTLNSCFCIFLFSVSLNIFNGHKNIAKFHKSKFTLNFKDKNTISSQIIFKNNGSRIFLLNMKLTRNISLHPLLSILHVLTFSPPPPNTHTHAHTHTQNLY